MFLAKISINRPIMTTMGILVFLIFGILAYFTLNLNQMPDVEVPFVTIQTVYPGAGPKEVETLVTKRLEDAISTVSKIERIESYSLESVSIVMVEFKLDKDVDIANQEIKDKIDVILNDLPDDAESPIVQKFEFGLLPIIEVVLSGNLDPRELYEIADKQLKDRFSQIGGVANVEITGGQERELRVIMDNKTIIENKISLPQFLQILAANNLDIPGGNFQIQGQEYTVRLEGEFSGIDQMKELKVPTAFGSKRLEQLADIVDAGKDVRQRAIYFDNKTKIRDENVVRMGIIKSSDGNVVKVADAVKASLPEIRKTLPAGTTLEIVDDRSDFTRSTVNDTMSNIILGVVFTSIVLLIFLANIRSTFIVALSMPISIIATFMLFQIFDLTLNMMTLMGLSVSVGVLVANSVVVLENIFRHKEMGNDNKRAAFIGTTEVTVAVVAATLTNLVVFLPIANMSSMVGRVLRELALSASFATIFSLVFSFSLTPMLASLMLPRKIKKNRLGDALNRFFKSWDRAYGKALSLILKNKGVSFLVLGISVVLVFLISFIYGPKIGVEFIPHTDDGKIKAEVELPEGYDLSESAALLSRIEERLKKHDEVVYLLTNLGKISDMNTGTNVAKMDIKLVDSKEREKSIEEMISIFTRELADISNANIKVDYNSGFGGGGPPIQFFLKGQDMDELDNIKDGLMKELREVKGLINLDQSSRSGKPEITVFPDRLKLADAGLTIQTVALTLRAAVEGMESSKYREYGNEYDITLTMADDNVDSPSEIGNIPVVAPTGIVYRLSQLADVKFTRGYSKILHRDKYISIQFTGSPAEGVPTGNVIDEISKILDKTELPAGYSFQWGGNTKMMFEMFADMIFAFALAVILTYMLLAAILESFVQPLFILLTIPLGLMGVFTSLYYFNLSYGITSLMGIIMLIGIVVNNAILILDYTNQLVREEGRSAKEALLEAAPTKLKPILMSTLAIILGMLPMALGIGDAGAKCVYPLVL